MKFFRNRKKEEPPFVLTGYVEKTDVSKKPVGLGTFQDNDEASLYENRAELLYGEKTPKKKIVAQPVDSSVELYEEVEPEIVIEKDDRKVKKEEKGKAQKEKFKLDKVATEPRKQARLFINELNHLKEKYDEKDGKMVEKLVLLASEGELGEFADLGEKEFIIDANENLKMANKDTYMNTPFAHEHTIYNNVSEVSKFLRPYVEEKIKSQLGTSALKTTKGIFIDNDKPSSIRIANNEKIQDKIREKKVELKAYGYVKETSIEFPFLSFNLKNAIGRADIVDIYLHKNGEITFYVIDTYDFNKNSTNPFVKGGYINQIKGNIIPYFMIYSVKIDKETSEELLK